MKKLCVLTGLILFAFAVFSQNNKVVNAYNYLRNGQLDKAKENIDAAILHPQTANQAKTWLYKGNVYLAISATENEKYKELHPDPLQEAYDAYQKSIEIDKDYIQPTANPPKAEVGLFIIGEQYYNKGVELFYIQQYESALEQFEKTKKISNIFNMKDSLATFNAALCAIQLEQDDKAIQYLRELVTINYMNPMVYSYLAHLYIKKEDYQKALQVVKGGKTKFPDDLNFVFAENNVYVSMGDFENALKTVENAIEKNPENPLLYLSLGSNYDQMSRDSLFSDEERMELIEKAEKSYLQAVTLDPDYFDAYYNLGALFFNEGARLFQIAQDIQDFKEYAKIEEKFKEMWNRAIPYLEKASEINPDDIYTLVSLRELYLRLSMNDKYKEVEERIKVLQGE